MDQLVQHTVECSLNAIKRQNICDAIKQNEPKSKNMILGFWHFVIRILFRLWFGENTMEIGQLVPKIQTYEWFYKQ